MVAKVLEKKKADKVVVIDLRDKTIVADYFVICSATSDVHAKALIEAVKERLKKSGSGPFSAEGGGPLKWFLVDCGDVIIHIFSPEAREYYKLEEIWVD